MILTLYEILTNGGLFGAFPEGTYSPDGRLYKGRTGVARMAIEAGVPVIPVAMTNTDRLPRLTRPTVAIGGPLDFSRYQDLEQDRFVLRSVTDEIMYVLMELSGQEYIDLYATKAQELRNAGQKIDDHSESRPDDTNPAQPGPSEHPDHSAHSRDAAG